MKKSNAIVNPINVNVNHFSVIIGETTKTETGTRKANKVKVPVYTLHNDKSISDFAAAYLMEESKRATYRALKTVFQKSADSTIYRLMRECAETLNDTAVDFENYQTDKTGAAVVKAKRHTKRRDLKLNKMFLCRPYTTFHFTETGKALNDGIKINKNLDVFDLINTAYLAYLEVVNVGAVMDYRDIKRNRGYVYKCLRHEIYANKKAVNESEMFNTYCIVTDDSGNETVYTGTHIDRYVKVDIESTTQVILAALEKIAHKNADVQNAVKAFELYTVDGLTQAEIADIMEVKQQQIAKWMKLVRRIVDNAETRQMLAELM